MGEGHDCRWGRRVAARRGPDRAVERDHGHRTRRDSATFAPPSENQAGENQAGSPFPRARAARRPDWSPRDRWAQPPPEETDERSRPQQPYTPYAASAPKRRPRALWFVLGAVMMLLGLVIGMVVIVDGGPRRHRRGRRDHGQRPGGRHRLAGEQVADALRAVGRTRRPTATSSTAPDEAAAQAHDRGDRSPVTTGGQEWRAFTPDRQLRRRRDHDHLPAGHQRRRAGPGRPAGRPGVARRRRAGGDRGDPGARRRRVRGPAGDHDPVGDTQAPGPLQTPPRPGVRCRPGSGNDRCRAAPPGWARAVR